MRGGEGASSSKACLYHSWIHESFVRMWRATGPETKRMDKVNLAQKFSQFAERWQPRIVGELNGQLVKIARVQGEFVWHKHDDEDEMFLVVKGSLTIRLRNRDVELNESEFFIVPRGVEHQPVADDEAWIMLFEPAGTLNTGDVRNERTVERLERI